MGDATLGDAQVRSHQDVRHRLSSRGGLLLASLAPGHSERDQARALLGLDGAAGVGGSAAARAQVADKPRAPASASSSTPKLDAFRRRYDDERRQRRTSAMKEQKKEAAHAAAATADVVRATRDSAPEEKPKSVSAAASLLTSEAVAASVHAGARAEPPPAPPVSQTEAVADAGTGATVAVAVAVAGVTHT